jgi:hypothetical protein
MNDLLTLVVPTTKAIIWLQKAETTSLSHTYKTIDYLSDGMLTQSLPALHGRPSLVLISKNFGAQLLIMVVKEIVPGEMGSFQSLLGKELDSKDEILVIDENDSYDRLVSVFPKSLKSVIKKAT